MRTLERIAAWKRTWHWSNRNRPHSGHRKVKHFGVDILVKFNVFTGDEGSHTHTHSHDGMKTVDPRRQHGHEHGQAKYKPTDFDMDKLRSTLKQFVRDWSEDVCISVIRRVFPVRHEFIPGESRA